MNPDLIYKAVVECDWWEAEQWCNEYVGKWNVDWYKLGVDPAANFVGDFTTTWYFKEEKKMLLFALRWSS